MSVDTLRVQVAFSAQRLAQLQRRAEQAPVPPPPAVTGTLTRIERTMEELRLAQEQLIRQREALVVARHRLTHERKKYWQLFDADPEPRLVTTEHTGIVEANRAAAELLNVSQKFLVGKELSVFVSSERGQLVGDARRLAESGGAADWLFAIRPLERAPLRILARVVAATEGRQLSLRWVLRRLPGHHTRAELTDQAWQIS